MARIRTIKPDFFLHEDLADLTPLHRLLFIGLWTLADKDGRMEDRPKRIKAALLPWDNCDVHEMLEDLHDAGLIHRYEADVGCIAIPSFLKHQRPHPKEPASTLPGPVEPWKKTASREKKRQEIKVEPFIPSSPVGREGKESRKESREGASETAPPSRFPVTVVAPSKDPDTWDGDDFWCWAQSVRQDGGLVAEAKPVALGSWFNTALMTEGVTIHVLKEAFYEFGHEKHWEAQRFPFRAFMSQWASFARKDGHHAAAS